MTAPGTAPTATEPDAAAAVPATESPLADPRRTESRPLADDTEADDTEADDTDDVATEAGDAAVEDGGTGPTGSALSRMIDELRAVTWPTRAQFFSYTAVVVTFLVVVTTLVGLVDSGLSALVLSLLG